MCIKCVFEKLKESLPKEPRATFYKDDNDLLLIGSSGFVWVSILEKNSRKAIEYKRRALTDPDMSMEGKRAVLRSVPVSIEIFPHEDINSQLENSNNQDLISFVKRNINLTNQYATNSHLN